ncbi:VESICLE-ASSOCIATED MEMBRANE PROTEIN-ASSOCIATED PROTEIN [Salix koriyanagi]|uniref:VESICLE-ASSOCIATED MEMBRANE PROTEIN-ASSOCIATED PROTEIN n=1 Tax=Salix koriyanagi TaxID=2511006 RepID=A0A9Q0SMW4_9ROSI|nr:VESICLE-ASSOCIATED MEMBRANE PROTEIN-ASSOCIATED PROTEIN [Salix koriyanagi]
MAQLLEIQPQELKFVAEVKKQSSCSICLTNNTYHNVAFKVKTTTPKKYCVRPNVGVIDPKSTCEFIVTMQAQKVAPPVMVCKDKFLIQSTVVPVGTTEKDITSSTFAKNDNKRIEEVKMRVALISSP